MTNAGWHNTPRECTRNVHNSRKVLIMSTPTLSNLAAVDATVGARILLALVAPQAALQRRIQPPWDLSSARNAYATAVGPVPDEDQPNLFVVFNDLLLNQDAAGKTQADAQACYVGFNIPVFQRETGQSGMFHFRILTGNRHAVPGRFLDAVLADVVHSQHATSNGTDTTLTESFTITDEHGGQVALHLEYQRGPLFRITADRPNFPIWAATDPAILRVYQDDALVDIIRNDAQNINHTSELAFRVTVPELRDLFDGTERLVAIIANPWYARRVFGPPRAAQPAG